MLFSRFRRSHSSYRSKLAFQSLEGRRVLAAMNISEIRGEVFVDTNSNLNNDPGEEVANAVIELRQDTDGDGTFETLVTTTTTDANGDYLFDNLGPGTYQTVQQQQNVGGVQLQQGTSGLSLIHI